MKLTAIPLLTVFAFFVCSFDCNGQGTIVADKIARYFNQSNYDSLYSLLSLDFQAQFPRETHDTFYETNIRTPLGKIQSIRFVSYNSGVSNYAVNFVNGKLSLLLSVGSNELIEGMQWLPYVGESLPKRERSSVKSSNPKVTSLQKKIDSVALNFLGNPFTCGLSIGIIKDGKTTFYFYGQSKRESEKLPDENTIYEIGSITKTFTGLLLAKAVNAGKISLEDDIRKYLPGHYSNLEFKGSPIRVKHLSNHTSRLPQNPSNLLEQKDFNLNDPFKNYDSGMLFQCLKEVKLDTLPGGRFEYSNTGVGLLGVILSGIYKRPLGNLYHELITKGTGMESTALVISNGKTKHIATGYSGLNGEETIDWHWADFSGAGGLKSSLSDMIKYVQHQMKSGDKDVALTHSPTYAGGKESVGLNWMLFPYRGMTFIYHDGRTSGFSSICGFIKEIQTGIVVLNNSGVECNEVAFAIMKALIE